MKRTLKYLGISIFTAIIFCVAQSAKGQGLGNLKQFEAAVDSGSTVVLGRKLEKNEYDLLVETANRYPSLKDEILNSPNFTSGVKLLKQLLAEKESNALRADVVNRVFREVYGRDSTALEQADYVAQMKQQKKWYTVILTSERDRLQKDSKERTAMLNRVYNYAMGRNANAEDLKYWLPRFEHYTQVLAASREWLYSSKGAKDLVETVSTYIKVRTGKTPNESLVKNTMTAVSDNKLLFAEMLKSGIVK